MASNRIKLSEFKSSGLASSARMKTSARGNSDLIASENDESSRKGKNKYGNKKVVIDGIEFDSTWEGMRYSALKIQEKAGEISNLKLQVEYSLDVNGVHICKYVADFVYDEGGHEVVEDAKGVKTAIYRQKKKLMKAIHGIDIKETYRPPTGKKSARK